ncbi:MAG: hypothetical protein HRU43_06450 [Simkaniaceae bacterium]|jgi:hypothetical protein|nr:hypothetical protein [Simkaniaceae bacterium]
MLSLFKKKGFAAFGAALLIAGSGPSFAGGTQVKSAVQNVAKIETAEGWKKFHSVHGKCMVSLPESPEHVKQIMPFPEEGYNLRYDVYVSAHEKKAVYMMLIAQYPPFINESHAEMSLESFLNGLVTQNHDNELIFADLVSVQGYKAMDFFIQAKGTYFKGRAIMAENHLYLLAMECEVTNYLEGHFDHFINSFELVK